MFVVTQKRHSFCSAVRIRGTNFAAKLRMFKHATVWRGNFHKAFHPRQSPRIVKRRFARSPLLCVRVYIYVRGLSQK